MPRLWSWVDTASRTKITTGNEYSTTSCSGVARSPRRADRAEGKVAVTAMAAPVLLDQLPQCHYKLKSSPKVEVSKGGFDVLSIDGPLVMKSIVVHDRVKSRDIYDFMVLTRDHGYALEDIFAAIDAYQPIRNKDPEHFKSVVTGVIPVDKNDEGFSSIHLNVRMDEIYKYFKKQINDYEIRVVQQLRHS